MTSRSTYWIGSRPTDGKRCANTTAAAVLTEDAEKDAIFRMYRRFVTAWNVLELELSRDQFEKHHEICGAEVVFGTDRRFFLRWTGANKVHWVLEICFARCFKPYGSAQNWMRNVPRDGNDFKSIRLRWGPGGREEFSRWLAAEDAENEDNGEWTEYRD